MFEDTQWKLRRHVNPLTLTVSVLVFLLTTANISISFCRAYVSVHNEQPSFVKYIFASSTLDIATTLIGDAILISRCWITYSKSWRMIYFPILLWISTLALSITVIYGSATAIFESNNTWTDPLTRLLYALPSCHIVTNVYSTSTIIYRTAQLMRGNPNSEPMSYGISRIIAESGLLYTLASIVILLAAIVGQQSIFFPISCAINALATGITYNLILIRRGQHRARLSSNAVSVRQAGNTKTLSGLQFNVSNATSEDPAEEQYRDEKHRDPNTLA